MRVLSRAIFDDEDCPNSRARKEGKGEMKYGGISGEKERNADSGGMEEFQGRKRGILTTGEWKNFRGGREKC